MDVSDLIVWMGVGFIIGMPIWGWAFDWGGYEYIEQLGQSICEEEYGMDFESYIDNTLRCKPFTETYDGIKVEVPKGIIEND